MAGGHVVVPAMEMGEEPHDLGLAGKARASRGAISVPSVPEAVKRMRSAEGTSRRTSAAQRTSIS